MQCCVVVLLLFCHTVYGANDVKVVITPDPDTGERPVPLLLGQGDSGYLRCAVENRNPLALPRWQRCANDGKSCLPLSVGVNIYDDTRFAVKFEPPAVWVLILKTVQMDLEGTYKCYVNIGRDTKAESTISIKVYEKPYILRLLSDTEVTRTEQQEARLRCNATGLPQPQISWRRAGNAIMPNGGLSAPGSVLYIPKVQPEHRGTYFCSASNGRGVKNIRVVLKVQFKPIVTPQSDIVKQAKGYRVILLCNIESNPEVIQGDTYWSYTTDRSDQFGTRIYENVKFIRKSNNEATMKLTIPNVQSKNYGIYICGARNSFEAVASTGRLELMESSVALKDANGQIMAGVAMQQASMVTLVVAVVFSIRTVL